MKDLEKIKSEDLAAQVQDANPGNFAIEQEVAQLVGATVPAPTEPSADDARELGAQLLVFLRRALLPIRSALRTALAAIYAHLDSRCTAYTPAAYASYIPRPYDPMGSTPRTLPNLLTALTAFSARKISNGSAPNDGIPDGVSLARLIGEQSTFASVTKIGDDMHGWILNRQFPYFPNAAISMNCEKIEIGSGIAMPMVRAGGNLELPELTALVKNGFNTQYGGGILCTDGDEIVCPKLARIDSFGTSWTGFAPFGFDGKLHRCVVGTITSVAFYNNSSRWFGKTSGGDTYGDTSELIDWEFGQGTAVNLNLSTWNPTNVLADATKTATFLQNFREHIALRLTSNGSCKTLTLSQAVRDAIHAAEATYGIEAIIVTQKGWTLSPAPTA